MEWSVLNLFGVFSAFLVLCHGIAIDNGVLDVQLSCTETDITLSVVTQKPLFQPARIFVKSRSEDRSCAIQYPGDRISQRLVFKLPLSSCGMERTGRQGALQGATFIVTYIVSFHPVFVTKVDRAYRLICKYGGAAQTDLTAGLSVSMIPTEPLEGSVGMADCSYTVHKESANSPPVRHAKVGDKIFHVWQCTNLEITQYMWIHDCYVSPEFGTGERIIDSNGCTSDPVVIGDLDYGRQPYHFVTASHHAYKFADYPTLLWRCSISICDSRSSSANCRLPSGALARVPPLCGMASRFRRSANANSVELLSQLHVLPSETESANRTGFHSKRRNIYDVITETLEILDLEDDQIGFDSGSNNEAASFLYPERSDSYRNNSVISEDYSNVCISQTSFVLLNFSLASLFLLVLCVSVIVITQKRIAVKSAWGMLN